VVVEVVHGARRCRRRRRRRCRRMAVEVVVLVVVIVVFVGWAVSGRWAGGLMSIPTPTPNPPIRDLESHEDIDAATSECITGIRTGEDVERSRVSTAIQKAQD